jgi:hypothetical protein
MKNAIITVFGIAIVGLLTLALVPNVDSTPGDSSPMLAGQDWDDPIGSVNVIRGGGMYKDYLFVEYVIDSDEDWEITETHLAVEDDFDNIPQTKKGSPKIGHFEYNEDSDEFWDDYYSQLYANAPSETKIVYKIPLYVEGDHDWETGDTLYIAAHAVVENDDGDEETSWADTGYSFPGGSWALYFTATVPAAS